MAYSKVETLCLPVQKVLEQHTAGKPRQRTEALRSLLLLLLTVEITPFLKELLADRPPRGLITRLRRLHTYLKKFSNLPESMCARYKYHMSATRVRSRYDISIRTWKYIHGLAAQVDLELRTWVPLTSFGRFKWHDKLEEDLTQLDVLLDSRALNDMLVAAFEAYLSPRPKRRKGYEVYGIGLGSVRTVADKSQRKGVTQKHYVSVSRVQPQLSAEGAMGWVEPNDRSMLALLKASTTLFPHYQVVGDFHSHPYDQWADLVYHEGWTYSPTDQKANYQAARSMIQQGHRLMLAFIVAIARSGRKARPSRFRSLPNTIQLSVGDCRTVVAAYRSLESGRYSTRHLRLRLPGMLE